MHVLMHIQQLNLVLFKGIINYELKGLKVNKIVQSLHIIQQNFSLILKRKKERENHDGNDSSSKQQTQQQNDKMLKMVLLLIPML